MLRHLCWEAGVEGWFCVPVPGPDLPASSFYPASQKLRAGCAFGCFRQVTLPHPCLWACWRAGLNRTGVSRVRAMQSARGGSTLLEGSWNCWNKKLAGVIV